MNRRLNLYIFILAISVWLRGTSFAEESSKEEIEIQQFNKDFEDEFSHHDANKLGEFWTKDATFINPATGKFIQGNEAIVEEYKKWFDNNQAEKIEIKLKEINVTNPDEAVENGFFRVTLKGNEPSIEKAFSAVLAKENGKWKFKEVRQIPLISTPTHYNEIKSLAWLVGNWVDTDEDVDITSNFKWDKYKNFLIQHFNMKVYGQEILEGQQIIAWDPIEKKIRSWVFDSDGGFGIGNWNQKGNSWFVKTTYTLADGSKASAINIYTKKDDNTYTWASVERDVNGTILPDIKPVEIERISDKVEQ